MALKFSAAKLAVVAAPMSGASWRCEASIRGVSLMVRFRGARRGLWCVIMPLYERKTVSPPAVREEDEDCFITSRQSDKACRELFYNDYGQCFL